MTKANMPRTTTLFQLGLFALLITVLIYYQGINQLHAAQTGQGMSEIVREKIDLPPMLGRNNLLFVSDESPALLTAQLEETVTGPGRAHAPRPLLTLPQPAEGTELAGDAHGSIGGLSLSPNGRQAVFYVSEGSVARPWLLDLNDRSHPSMMPITTEGAGYVLGWHPNNRQVLYKAFPLGVSDPGLWLVDIQDGSHRQINVPELAAPEGLMAAAISPNGRSIVYAMTKGMGFGSEVWLTNIEGTEHQRLQQFDTSVVGSLIWSPNGRNIAFTTLLDSPVPYDVAGLWVMNADGSEPRFLTMMDGGHGQEPIWSQNNQALFFVTRENLEDTTADYESEALESSIRTVNVQTRAVSILVSDENARQIDLSLSANGSLHFVSNRNGTSEVWAVNPGGRLEQITSDGEAKRYPIVVPAVSNP